MRHNEDSRVKIPALLHFTRLGYEYISLKDANGMSHPTSDDQLTGSTGFAVLTPKEYCYREFNYLSLTSDLNISRLETVASGAAYPAVNPEVVASHRIAFPGKYLVEQFHHKVSSHYDRMQLHQKQNQELTQLRDWLLPMLMKGQVTVQS